MGTTLCRGILWGPHCSGVHPLVFKTQHCAWRSSTPSLSGEDCDGWLCPHQQQPEQEKSEPAPGHQTRLLTAHQEQEMSEALLCHHCSCTCHTHTPALKPGGSPGYFLICVWPIGVRRMQTGPLPHPCLLHCHRGCQSSSLASPTL